MELNEVGLNWDEFGKQDPLWAILTDPRYRGNRWDPNKFFETGRAHISGVMTELDRIGVKVQRRWALDFGCGVGRLTQALCEHFVQCSGVDIAPSMVAEAERYNRYGARCQYHVNKADNLRLFADNSFDFVFSLIVLQHLEPENAKGYIREFMRVLAPGGVLVFQVPSGALVGDATAHALPASAFRAEISLAARPVTIKANSVEHLRVRVRNASTECWPGGENPSPVPIQLGNHWLSSDGALVRLDDGRAQFRNDIHPQEEVELTLAVNAPSTPGVYLLELDMVQEGVAWFKDKGSQTCLVPLTVTEASNARQYLAPVMEMHGIPKPEVVRTVEEAGGKVIQAVEDGAAGVLTSYRYFVIKPATAVTRIVESDRVNPSARPVEISLGSHASQQVSASSDAKFSKSSSDQQIVIQTLSLHAKAINTALLRVLALEEQLKQMRG